MHTFPFAVDSAGWSDTSLSVLRRFLPFGTVGVMFNLPNLCKSVAL